MPAEPLRVLILEDVPMDAELVEYELERARIPFQSRCVDSRDAFLEALDQFQPDLILSDYTLPRFDGMAALGLARERAPSVPFLIVTGSVNEETAVGCMKAGATDYLLKSNLARIGPAIEAALARVQSRSEKARAEEALRRSEANLRAIFNTSLQAFVLGRRGGRVHGSDSTATGAARYLKTTVRCPLSSTRCSLCHLTARASTWLSVSRPRAVRSSTVSVWSARATSCSMIGPSSRSAVT